MAEQWTFENLAVMDAGGKSVCLLPANPLSEKRGRLIAAAPDLLNALQAALPALEALHTEELRRNRSPVGRAMPKTIAKERHEVAVAAIAKAES